MHRLTLQKKGGDSVVYYGVIILLLVIGVSRYDATSFLYRDKEIIDFYSWFWRYRIIEIFTPIDILIVLLIGAALAYHTTSSDYQLNRINNTPIYLLTLFVFLGGVHGLFNQGPEDILQDLLFEVRNYYYFIAAYLISRQIAWSEVRCNQLSRLFLIITAVITILGFIEIGTTPEEYRLSKYDTFVFARDASDNIFVLFSLFWLIAIVLERGMLGIWYRIMGLAALAYGLVISFAGVSKTMLFVFSLVLLYYWFHYKLFKKPFAVLLMFLITIAGIGVFINQISGHDIQTSSPFHLYTTFDLADQSYGTRLNQIENCLESIRNQPSILISGLGMGVKWYEYKAPFVVDLAAYPTQELGSGWHLGSHVPFMRIFYDFGGLGLVVILYAFAGVFINIRQMTKTSTIPLKTRALLQAGILVVIFQISINNLASPKTNLIAGVLFGCVSSIRGGDWLNRRKEHAFERSQAKQPAMASCENDYQ